MGNLLGLGVQQNQNIANIHTSVSNLISPEAAAQHGAIAASKFGDSVVRSTTIATNGFVESSRVASDGFVHGTRIATDGLVQSTGIASNAVVKSATELGGAAVTAAKYASGAAVASSAIGSVGMYLSARQLGGAVSSAANAHYQGMHEVAGSVDNLGHKFVHAASIANTGATTFASVCGAAHVNAAQTMGNSVEEASCNVGLKSAMILSDAISYAAITWYRSVVWLGIVAICCSLISANRVDLAFAFLFIFLLAVNARKIAALVAALRKRHYDGVLVVCVPLSVISVSTLVGLTLYMQPLSDDNRWLKYFPTLLSNETAFKVAMCSALFIGVSISIAICQRAFFSISVALEPNGGGGQLYVSVDSVFAIVLGILLAIGIAVLRIWKDTPLHDY